MDEGRKRVIGIIAAILTSLLTCTMSCQKVSNANNPSKIECSSKPLSER